LPSCHRSFLEYLLVSCLFHIGCLI
jgi:glycerol-3-phosphate O-acyltransferase